MLNRSFSRAIRYIALPTGATIYGTHLGLSHLESKYPALPAGTGSTALRTPSNPSTQRCAYTDIYAGRVRVKALEARATRSTHHDTKCTLQETWARALLNSWILRTEGSIIGLLTTRRYTPGDTGLSPAGFSGDTTTNSPRQLLNGVFVVQRGIAEDAGNSGLLVKWAMPDGPREFFERIAQWGYPWRLMSGGRHELSVSEPFDVEGDGRMVEVRFSSAHDYEVVEDEGEAQKILPAWTMRLHRGYARLILDRAVKEMEQSEGS